MEQVSHRIAGGVALISIALAFIITRFAHEQYYGPIILMCVGAIMIALSFLAAREQRKIPVVGILLAALGVALIIEVVFGRTDIIIAVVLPAIVAATGLKMIWG
jgi:hypothetical protein